MPGVLEKRRQFLQLMRQVTLEQGHFTVNEIAAQAGCPRSTAQDWVNRLLTEQCIMLVEGRRGRQPARYSAISAMIRSACRRIFTTLDGEHVQIFHECLSSSCAAFCEHHLRLAGGVLEDVKRDGTLLRESARLGRGEMEIGLHPRPSMGVLEIRQEGDGILCQRIRCVGGPAYSLTEMMGHAEGVLGVRVLSSEGGLVEGEVTTKALSHLAIGIDDTDSRTDGATFALAIALLQFVSRTRGVMPIGHQVVILNPEVSRKTVGNFSSCIEVAVEPDMMDSVRERTTSFVSDESLSEDWGVAFRTGFSVPRDLRRFLQRARSEILDRLEASEVAQRNGVILEGGQGTIGALAAVSSIGLGPEVLLNPERPVPGA